MPTPNEDLYDKFVHRAIDVLAMTRTEARQLARDFAEQSDQSTLADLLALYLADRNARDREFRIEDFLRERRDALYRMKERMYRVIDRFTRDEGEFVSETVGPVQDETRDNHVFAALVIASLINRVIQQPVGGPKGDKFDDFFKELVDRDIARIRLTLTRAYTGNFKPSMLARALRKDFALNATTIEIVLHEMVQHARSVTTDLAMASVGGYVRWVSILDSRTSPVCRARSGRIYPAGSGPRPPAHARCRSTIVPYFKGKGEYEEPTYEDWLRKQTPDRVREILGKTKGSMFLEGNLSLADMVTAQGRELTLKELAARR